MLVAFVVDVFGNVRVSTPSVHLAVTRIASTARGNPTLRINVPWLRDAVTRVLLLLLPLALDRSACFLGGPDSRRVLA